MENLLIPYQAAEKIPAKRVLIFAPHPDDEVFGCGGAIMRHIEQHVPVQVIIVTNGAYGIGPNETTDYIQQRQNESIAAAVILGYGIPVFWQYHDRDLFYGEKLITEILAAIQQTGADLVYAPSIYEIHPDHRALGMAMVEAVRRLDNPIQLALYEVGIPLHPNLLLDISDLATRKKEAMGCFTSQNAKQRYDLDIAALNRYRTYTLPAEVTAAEAYILLSAEELAHDPLKLYQSEHTRQKSLGLPLDGSDLPLVSVIIRSMDRPTLLDALDSVALQTYSNIEVVVVDAKGESHREMGEWCGRFPLRIVSTGRRLKRSPAANFGLDSASGAYFIFLDDDDLFDPDHIANLVETLNNSKNCSVAYAGVRVENETGTTAGIYNQTFAAARLMAGNFIPIHAALFKRELVTQGCRFDENLDCYEDWDFWLQVARKTEFAHTAKVSAVYRAELGDSGMSLPLAHHLQLQRQCRLTVWEKWRHEWAASDFDRLVTDFRQQIALLQEQSKDAADVENKLQRLLAEKENLLADLLAEKENLLAEHEERITALNQTFNQTVSERNEQIMQLQSTIAELLDSRSWKLTAPIRFFSHTTRKILQYGRPASHLALHYYRRKSGYKLLKRAFSIMRNEGLYGIKWRLSALHNHHEKSTTGLKAKPAIKLKKHNYLPLSTIDITKYDYFFFDVFDTAIFRLFQRPIDLFEYISFKTKNPDFHLRRVQQEAKTREQYLERKEISVFEIYNNLADDSIEEEIAAELKFCVANPEVYNFYSRLLNAGKKIYFVSDMYLDKSTISRILKKSGFCTYEAIYVSSEDDLIKGDGSRFKWLKKNMPESAGSAIHIGDNRIADFLQPRAHGFDAFHFMESSAYYQQDSFLYSKIEFLNAKRSLGLSFLISTFRYWKASFHDRLPNYWRQFGFFYGGALVSAFCGFIKEQRSKQKLSCSKIFFLARDGDIMSQVYRLLYDDVEAVYLMASRRCVSFPSLKNLTHADDGDALKLFTTPIDVAGTKDVMERFGYPDLHNLEADLDKIAGDPSTWTDQDIRACILRNKKSIMEKVVAERSVIFDYLTEMGFFDQDDIVIVDVGWGGTIQNGLVKLMELGGYSKRRLHGIYLGVNSHVAYQQNKTGFLFNGDQSQFAEYLNLIELITSSPQNGIVRIDRVNGNFIPVAGTISAHERQRQLVAAEIQKGILDFAHLIKQQDISNLDFIRVEDFKALFMSLQAHASEEDAFQLGQLRHASMLGNNYGQHVLTNT